jgi:hypothetical protein
MFRRASLVLRSWGDVSAWSRVPPEAPALTPHAPSQKGWFWVRPQTHSAARVSRGGPSGVSRTRSPRTSSGPPGGHGRWWSDRSVPRVPLPAGGSGGRRSGSGALPPRCRWGRPGRRGSRAGGLGRTLRQPADAFGVMAAAAPVVEHGHLRGRIGPAKPVVVRWGGHGHSGTAGSPATKSAWSGWRRR